MILHIFNPDHELVLASDSGNVTPPKAASRLCSDLGFLPALWASDGDAVLVDDVDFANRAYKRVANRIGKYGCRLKRGVFVDPRMLHSIVIDKVEPWGWNTALRNYLIRHGVRTLTMPSLEELSDIRLLSHRSTAMRLLTMLRGDRLVGEMRECRTANRVAHWVGEYGKAVLKAPWSCSGRGVRFVTPDLLKNENLRGWMKNMLTKQGSLMVEPYYNKVKDFGMEFRALPNGDVEYLGLSLFKTLNGAYTGNVLATERNKEEHLSRYVGREMLEKIRNKIAYSCSSIIKGAYVGPFGIDMMVVGRDDRKGFMVHPCVEVNLRKTMGHVALGISPCDDETEKVMRISAGINYVLKINSI